MDCSGSPSAYMEECLTAMKADGARITRTRRAVIQCLARTQHPLSPQVIASQLAEQELGNKKEEDDSTAGSIDLASVYRILKYMVSLGLVHQLGPDGGFFPCTHTKCNQGVHLLTRCEQCENTEELHIPNDLTSGLLWYLAKETRFRPQSHVLEIRGTCAGCSTSVNAS